MTDTLTPKANIMLDMSKFDLFQLCEARYNMRHNMNKTLPTSEKARSLDDGGLVHEGYEVYYKMLAENKHFNDRVHATLMKVREVASDPETSNAEPEDLEKLIITIEQNLEYWRAEDETFKILAVEQPFAYVLYEDESIRIIISGKIDLIVDIPQIGRNAGYQGIPFDHKTFSRDSQVLELSNQFENYCIASGSNYLIVNRIGLHDPTAKKPKPPEEKFKRHPLSYDPFMLQEFKDNTTAVILDNYLTCVATGRWKMNWTSCLKFNRLCEYYEVCRSSGKEAKVFKLNSNYVTVPEWDVTANMGKEKE